MQAKKIRSIILVMDQNIGAINLMPEENGSARLANLDLNSYTTKTLSQLSNAGIRIMLLPPKDLASDDSLQQLKEFIPLASEIIPYEQDLSNTLSSFSQKSSSLFASEQSIFVAADRMLRGQAAKQGYLALPHLSIAALAVEGSSLYFVKVRGEERRFSRIRELVPYYLERSEHEQMTLLAVMSQIAISQAISSRLSIEILPLDFSVEDAMFVSLDRIDDRTPEKLKDQKVLFSDGHNMLVALGPFVSNDSVPFHDKHGHFFFIHPNPTLLKPVSEPSNALREADITFARWPLNKTKITRVATSSDQALFESAAAPPPPKLSAVDPVSFQSNINRYSGISDLDNDGKIISRHCEHPDNSRAIKALIRDLRSMGYSPFVYPFSYRSKTIQNVIADLPGTGYFKAEPNLSEQIRQILLKYPSISTSEKWIKEVTNVVGQDWFLQQELENLSPLDQRKKLEEIFLKGSPWWLSQGHVIHGLGSQMIIVCCHMDSTANNETEYDKMTDPAPGADDNSSGVAATLAIARYLSQFRGKLVHTVRFCFFNAEEEGLHGSEQYAGYLRDKDTNIKAVINLDMMGYNNDQERAFEIHAGCPNPKVRDLCVPVANFIKQWAENLGKLGPAQIYKGTKQGGPEDYDRDEFDGAIRRSDHYSFQYYSYPACHISEDFFANLPTEPRRDPNPNYHTFKDKIVDKDFASDITTVAAFAVEELASK